MLKLIPIIIAFFLNACVYIPKNIIKDNGNTAKTQSSIKSLELVSSVDYQDIIRRKILLENGINEILIDEEEEKRVNRMILNGTIFRQLQFGNSVTIKPQSISTSTHNKGCLIEAEYSERDWEKSPVMFFSNFYNLFSYLTLTLIPTRLDNIQVYNVKIRDFKTRKILDEFQVIDGYTTWIGPIPYLFTSSKISEDDLSNKIKRKLNEEIMNKIGNKLIDEKPCQKE